MEVMQRVIKFRLRENVKIDLMQFDFVPDRRITDPTFIVRLLQLKFL